MLEKNLITHPILGNITQGIYRIYLKILMNITIQIQPLPKLRLTLSFIITYLHYGSSNTFTINTS